MFKVVKGLQNGEIILQFPVRISLITQILRHGRGRQESNSGLSAESGPAMKMAGRGHDHTEVGRL